MTTKELYAQAMLAAWPVCLSKAMNLDDSEQMVDVAATASNAAKQFVDVFLQDTKFLEAIEI